MRINPDLKDGPHFILRNDLIDACQRPEKYGDRDLAKLLLKLDDLAGGAAAQVVLEVGIYVAREYSLTMAERLLDVVRSRKEIILRAVDAP